MKHDKCYISCGNNSKKCIKRCDKEMVNNLKNLDDDPTKWPNYPRPGTEGDSRRYRRGAILIFGD